MLPDSSCQPPPHNAAPLQPPVVLHTGTNRHFAFSFPLTKWVLPLPNHKMSFLKISKLGFILISSVLIQKFSFLFKLQWLKFFFTIFFRPKNFSFSAHSIFDSLFDLHNSVRPKQPLDPTNLTGFLPPQINTDAARLRLSTAVVQRRTTTSSGRSSTWEPRVTLHASFPF
jgi:hypothetical protein